MKVLITLALIFVSQAVRANEFDDACKNRYREAALSLIASAESFNDQTSTGDEFLAGYALIEARIGALRLACTFEPAGIKECVRLYKKEYHKISDGIDISAIARGEQNRVKVGLVDVALTFIDFKCQ